MSSGARSPRLRLLWSDLLGLDRGKYLYGRKAEEGQASFAVTTFATTLHRSILPIRGLAYDVGLADMQARCDPSTLREGWEENTRVGVADLFRDGERLAIDPRHVLREACRPWIERGLWPQLAFELEFYLLRPCDDGHWLPLDAPGSRVYGTGTAVDPERILDDILASAAGCAFPLEGWSSEFDDSQFELNLEHGEAVATADDAFLLRVLVRERAAERGHRVTFLGKPFPDRAGSGLHVNLSFRTASGENALVDSSAPDGLADLARHCVAGMLAHHEALAALCAPTVNAYRRLQPDMMNGYWGNWGYDDRTVAVRISADRGPSTRLEHRTPDGAASPYLVAAALLHAARFGVEGQWGPPPPQPVGESPSASRRAPDSLAQALEALGADQALGNALGRSLVGTFTAMKRAEWERYLASVPEPARQRLSEWELAYYGPFF